MRTVSMLMTLLLFPASLSAQHKHPPQLHLTLSNKGCKKSGHPFDGQLTFTNFQSYMIMPLNVTQFSQQNPFFSSNNRFKTWSIALLILWGSSLIKCGLDLTSFVRPFGQKSLQMDKCKIILCCWDYFMVRGGERLTQHKMKALLQYFESTERIITRSNFNISPSHPS